MISEAICDCAIIFDDEAAVKWHKTTEGHLWNKLKTETNNNYVYNRDSAKMKIPENVRCDICGEPAHLKRLRVKGRRVPDWYVVDKLSLRSERLCPSCGVNLEEEGSAKINNTRGDVVGAAITGSGNITGKR